MRQIVAQRESPVMLRVWGRLERVPDDDANCLALWERCAYEGSVIGSALSRATTALLSEIFRGYNDWLAEFCAWEPKRLKGIAMINVDDVQEGR